MTRTDKIVCHDPRDHIEIIRSHGDLLIPVHYVHPKEKLPAYDTGYDDCLGADLGSLPFLDDQDKMLK